MEAAVEFQIEKTRGREEKNNDFEMIFRREKSDCQSHSGGHAKYIWMDKNRVESSGVESS